MTRKVLEQSDENPLRAKCRSSRVSDFEARGLRVAQCCVLERGTFTPHNTDY